MNTASRVATVDLGAALVILAMLALSYAVGLRPALEARAAGDEESRHLQQYRDEVRQAREASDTLEETMRRLRKQAEGSRIRLGRASEVNTRVDAIAGLASEAGLTLDSIKPDKATRGTRYDAVPLDLAGTGTYRSCTQFLHVLRERFPDVAIMGFDIRAKPEPPAVRATFAFRLFWFTEPSGKPASNSAPTP